MWLCDHYYSFLVPPASPGPFLASQCHNMESCFRQYSGFTVLFCLPVSLWITLVILVCFWNVLFCRRKRPYISSPIPQPSRAWSIREWPTIKIKTCLLPHLKHSKTASCFDYSKHQTSKIYVTVYIYIIYQKTWYHVYVLSIPIHRQTCWPFEHSFALELGAADFLYVGFQSHLILKVNRKDTWSDGRKNRKKKEGFFVW